MKKIILLSIYLTSLIFYCPSNGQITSIKSTNKDSIMEKSIIRVIESGAERSWVIPEDLKTYSLLFVINYDSSTNGIITVTIDTFLGSKLESKLNMPEKRLLYKEIVSDSARYRKIISMYHPSNSLSVIVPMFWNHYPTDSQNVLYYPEVEDYMVHLMAKIKDCYAKKRELYFSKPISSYYSTAIH